MIPFWLTRPTAGLIPTPPLAEEGQMMEPSVSVPTATGVRPAATATADPLEEPQGDLSRTCGLRHCRPRPLHPPDDREERKLAHSLRFVLPSMSIPAARRRATSGASAGAGTPMRASEPAVVCMRSPVSMLSLTRIGMPCSGPRTRPSRRSLSSRSAISTQSGLISMTERRFGPTLSMAAIRSRCISARRRTLSSPLSRRRDRSASELSASSGGVSNAKNREELLRHPIQLCLFVGVQGPQRSPAMLLDPHASPDEQVLERRLKRKALYLVANLAQSMRSGFGGPAHNLGHRFRKRRREPRYRAHGAHGKSAVDQGLRPDEDLEPIDQIWLEPLPWGIRHLQPDEVRQAGPQLLDDCGLYCVTATCGELVNKKGQRRAGPPGGGEVFDERIVVEREVGRRDHRHRVCADLGRVRGELDRGGSCLRAAVHDHYHSPVPGLNERFSSRETFGGAQQDALACRAESKDPVDAGSDQVVDHRSYRLQIDRVPAFPQRRHRRGDGAAEHGLEILRHFSISVRGRKH